MSDENEQKGKVGGEVENERDSASVREGERYLFMLRIFK